MYDPPYTRAKIATQITLRIFLGLTPTSPYASCIFGAPLLWLCGRRKDRKLYPHSIRRVLIVRLDEIGDVVLTTPLLRELRRLLPNARITLLVKPPVRNLVEQCPYVDEVLTSDWTVDQVKGVGQQPRQILRLAYRYLWQHYWRTLRFAHRHLWQQHFDLAIVPRWDADYYHSAHIAYFSGAANRIGYAANVTSVKKILNDGVELLFTQVLPTCGLKHEAERSLDVVRALGGTVHDTHLEAWVTADDEEHARTFLASNGVGPNDTLIALGPGARDPKRLWPLEQFAELSRWLISTHGARILVVGGPGEEALGHYLQAHLGTAVISAIGQATLRQTEALLQCCNLFVGNDTGLMHLAAAVGTSVVEISCHPQEGLPSHYNSPMRFGPWGVPHVIVQPQISRPPCSGGCTARQAHCIAAITVSQAQEAVASLLRPHGHPTLAMEKLKHAR